MMSSVLGRPARTLGRREVLVAALLVLSGTGSSLAVETGIYRLLSVTETSKLILISHPNTKTKYLLDASTAKVTLDGKPAEFGTLKQYSTAQVFFEVKKGTKDGVEIDGTASEIRLTAKTRTR
jgi:hypothetical protein